MRIGGASKITELYYKKDSEIRLYYFLLFHKSGHSTTSSYCIQYRLFMAHIVVKIGLAVSGNFVQKF